jgi:hypothetical protein
MTAKLFEAALGIAEPWLVASVDFDEKAMTLRRLCWHALAAHEHTLIDQHLEHTHGPGFVQAAFVATDGHTIGRIFE